MIFLEYFTEQPETPKEALLVSEARIQGAKLFAATLARANLLPITEAEADAICDHINIAAKIVLRDTEGEEDALLHRVTVREIPRREEGTPTNQG